MIAAHRLAFGRSRYFAARHPDLLIDDAFRGPVVHTELVFERWFDQQPLKADIFVDPGADRTIISRRWIDDNGLAGSRAVPRLEPGYVEGQEILGEGAFVILGGRAFALPQSLVLSQPGLMPGCEDVLLGRDFLVEHDVLLVVDGQERSFSLLVSDDADNQRRREQILTALDPSK